MEDLQSTLQSILSDPEQMARVASLAESLGLKPPDVPPQTGGESGSAADRQTESPAWKPQNDGGGMGLDLGRLMGQLAAMSGSEDRVLNALRPTLSPDGQHRVDRALRAAKLSRLAGLFLKNRGDGHV